MRRLILLGLVACMAALTVHGQDNLHRQSTVYEWPADTQVRQKLEHWRDQKFGMIIHWGLYAVPGIIESWELCSEDWISRDSTITYDAYKQWYWGLKKDFNPTQFNPDQWAQAAKDAGMRYVVFTTKHHDGFNMFDTKQTDFKITNGPFANHPKANVAKYVFESFRKQGFMIGAYYSKPDWHSEYFWWPRYATPDRNVNYDIRKNPWRWNKFKQFAYNQVNELMHDYGAIDILWLDGGWVRPLETVNDEVRAWGAAIPPWSQEIDIPRIATMARAAQPGLLIVDRTVHGPYENYQTPEQHIPATRLDHPWESCITLGGAWGHVPNDKYKSAAKVIHTLAEVVAKGGSLLLGVGPTPEGTLRQEQIDRLKDIGAWLTRNGAAIYDTRPAAHYQSDKTFFTTNTAGKLFAISCLAEDMPMPRTVSWKGNVPRKGTRMTLLSSGATVKWSVQGDIVTVSIPASVAKSYTPALTLAYDAGK
ncbi:alpha-L-fucosidase [Fulvivirgaceae bacterium PWU5]|uniref:alpha-L-fucosidase n=2 Tax=Dawidia cretensis TaxID=2782350 RepID=A0AAP2E0L3_9BACT|nr:alpha-L-fucosidase [Dawidia cretensis]MBT1709309.1 alpha-L-fucosidase [Dawidia cretensis]